MTIVNMVGGGGISVNDILSDMTLNYSTNTIPQIRGNTYTTSQSTSTSDRSRRTDGDGYSSVDISSGSDHYMRFYSTPGKTTTNKSYLKALGTKETIFNNPELVNITIPNDAISGVIRGVLGLTYRTGVYSHSYTVYPDYMYTYEVPFSKENGNFVFDYSNIKSLTSAALGYFINGAYSDTTCYTAIIIKEIDYTTG